MGSKSSKSQDEKPSFSNITQNTYTESTSTAITSTSSSSTSSNESAASASTADQSPSKNELANELTAQFISLLEAFLLDSKTSADVHICTCNYCEKKNFNEYRYKCLVCNDYDLCGKCFESRRKNESHECGHPIARFDVPKQLFGISFENVAEIDLAFMFARFGKDKHENTSCDGCSKSPIEGLRFKCDTCNDYDLCYSCFKGKKCSDKHSTDHPLVIQLTDSSLEVDMENIQLMNELGKGAFGAVYKSKLDLRNSFSIFKILK